MDVNKLLKEDYQKWKNNQYIFQKEQGRFEGKTFGQFTEDTYRLAEHLLRLGLSDEKVIIYGRNSYALMVADLAVTAFVGISVVVAKDMKGESVRKLAEAIDAKAILYASEKEETVQKILETMHIRTICFDEIPRLPECEQLFQLTSRNPDVCSKIVFSSGTTGPSKGVQLSLRNIFFGYSELSKRVQYTTEDRVYLFLPLNHVYASCYCYYLSLIDGYQIYLASSTSKIAEELLESQPTFFCAVPLVYQKLLDQYGDQIGQAFGSRIRFLFCSGAPCPKELRSAYRGLPMLQAFGMSETAASFSIDYPGDQDEDSAGTIFSNIDARIFDPDEQGVGEIIVKGGNVFLGYLDEQLTKECFDENGYFHTGDIGKIRNGKLIVLQRKKKTLVGSNGETMDVSALSEMLCSLDDNILRADLTLVHDRLSADLYVKDPNRSAANAVEQYNQMVLRHERIEHMNIIPDSLDKRLK